VGKFKGTLPIGTVTLTEEDISTEAQRGTLELSALLLKRPRVSVIIFMQTVNILLKDHCLRVQPEITRENDKRPESD